MAPYTTVNILLTRYYFTIKLPANSLQSLGQVTIKQGENPEAIAFKLSDTQAFEGTQDNKGQPLTLKEVNEDPPKKTIAVSFEPPVPPGTTLTISLLAKKNPFFGGVYLFRVYAFPAGANPVGLNLGVGRLQFYEPGGFFHIR